MAGDQTVLQEILSQAATMADQGEEERALEMLLEHEPDHADEPTLLCMLGVLCRRGGAEGMAMDFFRRCVEQAPGDPELLVTAGAALAAAGDPAADGALRLAALTAPQHAPARMHYGAFLVRSGLTDQGLEELVEAARLAPDDPHPFCELGIGYLLARRQGDAILAFENALGMDEEDVDVRILLGLALLQADDVERAAEELHPLALALDQDGEVQLLLTLVFAAAGWEDEAWLALSRAEAAPEPVDPASLGEVEEALEAGDEAVRSLLFGELAPTFLRDRLYRTVE